MADTAIPNTTLVLNTSTAQPAGTAIVAANTHVITPTKEMSKLIVRLNNTFVGSKDFTILAGDNPPADAAGQGNLVIALTQDATVLVPLESARFVQNDGTVRISVAAATTGFISAIQLP